MAFSDEIEHQIQTIGRELFTYLKADFPSALHFAWWDERILDWCMADFRRNPCGISHKRKTSANSRRHLNPCSNNVDARTR